MNLKDKHPKAWADFIEWYVELWYPWRLEKEFTDLPFEMQLGVYLKYFDDKENIFYDKEYLDIDYIIPAIDHAFKIREIELTNKHK